MADQIPVQRRMTDLLMLADAPWIATVIMGLSQPFAQIREATGLPTYAPLVVAFAASVLLATFWIRVEQKTSPAQSVMLVPVVAMLLFSASIGANNVIKAAATGEGEASSAARSEAQGVEILKQQNALLQKQLDIEKRKTAILGAPKVPSPDKTSRVDVPARVLSKLLSTFTSTAYAEDVHVLPPAAARLSPDQRRELATLVREQQQLETAIHDLESKKAVLDGGKGEQHLWKKW